MKLLLVEDDRMLAESICEDARQSGWHVDLADNAIAARMALRDHAYAAILLDFDLPRDSGLAILRWIRDRYDATPVLMLTARGQLSERIAGLDAGADGYLIKPIHLDELWARVRSVIRRSAGRVTPVFTCGDVIIDRHRRAVTRSGVDVRLSAQEFRTLMALVDRQGHVVRRAHLHSVVYGTGKRIDSNTVAVFIHQLKRKLGGNLIQTVPGVGYAIGLPAERDRRAGPADVPSAA
ncbi:response regulator transcription factor [Achromobacter sp. DH1f]|uniref:response regulator transcription factor n=1 Tax=Achromobacter sp. DH1f TaxID=1397275 RepID=UPI00046911C6|nr:response regulator transcription factor [Achromobacter sp. DH1f]